MLRFSDLKKHLAQQEEQSRTMVCVTIEQAKALNERAGDAAPGVVTQDWQPGEWYRIIPTVDIKKLIVLARKRKKAEEKVIAAMVEKEATDQIQAAFAIVYNQAMSHSSEQSMVTTDDDSDAQAEESTPL